MSLFKLNSKIELITENDVKTQGLIHDIMNDKIYVSITSDDKHFKFLHVGDYVNCIIIDDLTVTGFEAVVIERVSDDFLIYTLSKIKNFSKVQRREDVRVSCTIPVLYTKNQYLLNVVTENFGEEVELKNFLKYFSEGMMVDLSGGGLKFTSNDRFTINQILLTVLKLDKDNLFITGKVLHKSISTKKNKTVYTYGLQFIDIDEKKKERIIKFLFVLMRRNRLK